MEIFTLLETIEDMLENSKEVPFTHKAIIDKEEVLDIIKEIRLKLPEEFVKTMEKNLWKIPVTFDDLEVDKIEVDGEVIS